MGQLNKNGFQCEKIKTKHLRYILKNLNLEEESLRLILKSNQYNELLKLGCLTRDQKKIYWRIRKKNQENQQISLTVF